MSCSTLHCQKVLNGNYFPINLSTLGLGAHCRCGGQCPHRLHPHGLFTRCRRRCVVQICQRWGFGRALSMQWSMTSQTIPSQTIHTRTIHKLSLQVRGTNLSTLGSYCRCSGQCPHRLFPHRLFKSCRCRFAEQICQL